MLREGVVANASNLAYSARRTCLEEGMDEQSVQRKLAAILAADVVGYSRLMCEDQEGRLQPPKPIGMCG